MSGIYIHIPFCKQKCSYCDFHFSTNFGGYRDRMINAIIEELKVRSEGCKESITSVYFGGGTPSLLSNTELNALLLAVQDHFMLDKNAEITLEANPDDVTKQRVTDWKNAGITRFSLGVQSFRNRDLEWMNRAHNANEALASIKLIREGGFDNFSVDLIYGSPDLSEEDWKQQLEQLIDLEVPHISAYCLTIEERTVLSHRVRKGDFVPSSDDDQAKQFLQLMELTEKAGFEHYEISNFAKPGFRSKHNSSYWQGRAYIGVGPSAHSFDGENRSWNVANNMLYIKGIEEGNRNFQFEKLTSNDRFNELLLTGLRTSEGVSLEKLQTVRVIPSNFNTELGVFIEKGWAKSDDKHIRLTKEGRLRADYIASSLFIVS